MTGDPDLDQTCEDVKYQVMRLQQLDDMVVRQDPVKGYDRLAALLSERADLRNQVRVRAERLNLAPRALVLIVKEVQRLSRGNRKVVTAAVRTAIATAAEQATREKLEVAADLIEARHREVTVNQRLAATTAAAAYLEASQ